MPDPGPAVRVGAAAVRGAGRGGHPERHHDRAWSRSTRVKEPRLRCLVNTLRARAGQRDPVRHRRGRGRRSPWSPWPTAATTPRQIDELARLVERGVAVAAASRYMAGGQQVGGPFLKGTLSRMAGRSLRLLAHVGTRDATNSFKAYSTGLRPRGRHRLPGRLRDRHRADGQGQAARPAGGRDPDDLAGPAGRACPTSRSRSGFPSYLRWYRFAFGPRLTAEQIRDRVRRASRHQKELEGSDGKSSGQRVGRVHRRVRGRGTAAAWLRRGRASTTSPSTARCASPTTTTRATSWSRATPATWS